MTNPEFPYNVMTKYTYATIPAQVLIGMSRIQVEDPGAYIAVDAESKAYLSLLSDGFRLHTVTEDFAIFEKAILVAPDPVPVKPQGPDVPEIVSTLRNLGCGYLITSLRCGSIH